MGRGARAAATGLLGLVLLVPSVAGALPAAADPEAAPAVGLQARAAALRSAVEDLRLRQSVAVEAYDTAVSDVGTAATAEVRAQTALDRATGEQRSTASTATRRVRSLYIAGTSGQLATGLMTVLAVGDLDTLQSVARGARAARSARVRDTAAVALAADATTTARDAERTLSAARVRKTAAQADAEDAREQVTTALAQQERLFDAADAAVVAAVAAQEEEDRRRALADAAARAAALGVGSGTVTGTGTGRAGTGGPVADAPAGVSGTVERAVAAARTRTGLAYVWGATGPTTFDCSGLTRWAYAQAGVAIPRTSRQQHAGLPPVPLDQLRPGDLVFYASGSSPSSIHHVALYLGDGRVLHAPHTGDVVREASVDMPGLFGAVRPAAG